MISSLYKVKSKDYDFKKNKKRNADKEVENGNQPLSLQEINLSESIIMKLYLFYESIFCCFRCCKSEEYSTLRDIYQKGKSNLKTDFDLKYIIET